MTTNFFNFKVADQDSQNGTENVTVLSKGGWTGNQPTASVAATNQHLSRSAAQQRIAMSLPFSNISGMYPQSGLELHTWQLKGMPGLMDPGGPATPTGPEGSQMGTVATKR